MDVVRSGLGKQGFIYPGRAWPWNTLHCFHVERMDGVEKEVENKGGTEKNNITRLHTIKDDKL